MKQLPKPKPYVEPVDFSRCPLALFYYRASNQVKKQLIAERRKTRPLKRGPHAAG